MIKNVVLILASVLMVPVAVFADQQVEQLRKQAAASFEYGPYIVIYTLAPLVFTFVLLGFAHALTLTPRQKKLVGILYLLLGLFVVFYPMLNILIPALPNLPAQWRYIRDLTRMVGALLAVVGWFQVVDGRKQSSDTSMTHE